MTAKKKPRKGAKRAIGAPEKKKILAILRGGGSHNDAANRIGISARVIYTEKVRNKEFAKECKAARAEGKLKLIAAVFRDAKKDGRLALTALGRMYPKEWAEAKHIEHRGKVKVKHSGGVTIQSVLKAFDDRDKIESDEFHEAARGRLQSGNPGLHGDGSGTGEVGTGEAPAGD